MSHNCSPNTYGTGCTLSGALAAMLDFGEGSGPMNHTFDLQGKWAEAVMYSDLSGRN